MTETEVADTGETRMDLIGVVGRVYVWSLEGEYIESMPLPAMAARHDLAPGTLLRELLRLRRDKGSDPAPLKIAADTGDLFVTLTPKSPGKI